MSASHSRATDNSQRPLTTRRGAVHVRLRRRTGRVAARRPRSPFFGSLQFVENCAHSFSLKTHFHVDHIGTNRLTVELSPELSFLTPQIMLVHVACMHPSVPHNSEQKVQRSAYDDQLRGGGSNRPQQLRGLIGTLQQKWTCWQDQSQQTEMQLELEPSLSFSV